MLLSFEEEKQLPFKIISFFLHLHLAFLKSVSSLSGFWAGAQQNQMAEKKPLADDHHSLPQELTVPLRRWWRSKLNSERVNVGIIFTT